MLTTLTTHGCGVSMSRMMINGASIDRVVHASGTQSFNLSRVLRCFRRMLHVDRVRRLIRERGGVSLLG